MSTARVVRVRMSVPVVSDPAAIEAPDHHRGLMSLPNGSTLAPEPDGTVTVDAAHVPALLAMGCIPVASWWTERPIVETNQF